MGDGGKLVKRFMGSRGSLIRVVRRRKEASVMVHTCTSGYEWWW
jgi:hypothetical protein